MKCGAREASGARVSSAAPRARPPRRPPPGPAARVIAGHQWQCRAAAARGADRGGGGARGGARQLCARGRPGIPPPWAALADAAADARPPPPAAPPPPQRGPSWCDTHPRPTVHPRSQAPASGQTPRSRPVCLLLNENTWETREGVLVLSIVVNLFFVIGIFMTIAYF